MAPLYDSLGLRYGATRCTEPRIAEQLYAELRGADRIVNIGAGTGSYEPEEVTLVAVEPSPAMTAQRTAGSHKAVQASAEKLPFDDNSFSHAMTILSMHHWEDRDLAFREINRVTMKKFVAITWDPQSEPFWLTRDYFPEIYERDKGIFPELDEIREYFDDLRVRPLQIPGDCIDGFFAAFWKRPEAYLNRKVRQSMSSFSHVRNLSEGLEKLKADLETGAWEKNNRAILKLSSFDAGYRLITARIKNR